MVPVNASGADAVQVITVPTGAGEGADGVNAAVIATADMALITTLKNPAYTKCLFELPINFFFRKPEGRLSTMTNNACFQLLRWFRKPRGTIRSDRLRHVRIGSRAGF